MVSKLVPRIYLEPERLASCPLLFIERLSILGLQRFLVFD